ncbi:MAG: ABC transporter ATP-binding protein [Desulfomonile tiedjei]|uniref:ABC transporter ATP-binding protein n=1 Tax=Desulfomonile tiedjei TaxID=2358 RepID=A0A9D6UYS9_9BACT|nr:ABC transporter ATP-binding protein [Desulfomonile tiedjei]
MNQNDVPVIVIKDLSFSYDGHPVLEDVNLSIPKGDFVSVVGPNGGGKTTLLKLILGLLRPSRGQVQVFGVTPEEARSRIGYMPQHSQLDPQFPATVLDVALMGRLGHGRPFGRYSRKDKEIVWRALEQVGLHDLRKKAFSSISGGQRQRLFIARALACEPDLLLLDEPTANLDMVMEGDLYELLHTLNQWLTVVMVSHDLGFVSRVVKNVICVKRKVLMHATSEITGEIINEIYGSPMRMVRHNGEGSCNCFSS